MFEAQISYTKEDMLAYLRFQKKQKQKFIYILSIVINVMLVLLLALMLVFMVAFRDTGLLTYFLLLAVMGVLYQFVDRINAGALLKAQKNLENVQWVFEDEAVRASAATVESTYRYDSFRELFYSVKNRCFYLFINAKTALILPERCLTKGEAASLRSFLQEKTGLEVKEVK